MYKQLVVSHYEQDLTWVHNIENHIPVIIYDKSEKPSDYIKLENVGREPHTYMHHIIENYLTLAEWTIFSQDNPFVHVNNWMNIINGDEYVWHQLANYKQKGGYFFSNMGLTTSDQNGSPHHQGLPIAKLWNSTFNEKCPIYLDFTPSCHCIIHKSIIQSRSINFYQNVKYILENDTISPWALERYISYLFNPLYN
jgi:hypothetical protein